MDSVGQCLKDWKRNREETSVSNFLLSSVTKKYYTQNLDSGEYEKEMTEDDLKELWKESLIQPLNLTQDQKNKMLQHFSQYMHQGGYMHMLQAAFQEVQIVSDMFFSSGRIKEAVDVSVGPDGKSIVITEKLNIYDIGSKSQPTMFNSENKKVDPLMIATGKYVISIGADGNPACKISEVTLEHNSKKTKELFSPQKIAEYKAAYSKFLEEKTERERPKYTIIGKI